MTFSPPPAGVNYQRLRPYLEAALLEQRDKQTAVVAAQQIDRDEWRAIAQFTITDDDQVDLHSLRYLVEIEASDGWAPLCTVHWTLLGMEWADVERTWEEILRQHREGIFPGGPNDPGRRAGY